MTVGRPTRRGKSHICIFVSVVALPPAPRPRVHSGGSILSGTLDPTWWSHGGASGRRSGEGPSIAHIPRADSTEGKRAPLRKCASLDARDKNLSKRDVAGIETPCPRPGKP